MKASETKNVQTSREATSIKEGNQRSMSAFQSKAESSEMDKNNAQQDNKVLTNQQPTAQLGTINTRNHTKAIKSSLQVYTSDRRLSNSARELAPVPEQRDCEGSCDEGGVCDGRGHDKLDDDYLREIEAVWTTDNYYERGFHTMENMRIAKFIGSPIGRLKRSTRNSSSQEVGTFRIDNTEDDFIVTTFSPVSSPLTVDESEFFVYSSSSVTRKKESQRGSPLQRQDVSKGNKSVTDAPLGAVGTFLSIITCTAGSCDKIGKPLESPSTQPFPTNKQLVKSVNTGDEIKSSMRPVLSSEENELTRRAEKKQVRWFVNPCSGHAVDDLCYRNTSWEITNSNTNARKSIGSLNIEYEINQILGRCYGSEDDVMACWQVLVPRHHGMCGVAECPSDDAERQCTNSDETVKNCDLIENEIIGHDSKSTRFRNRVGDAPGRRAKIRSMQQNFLSLEPFLSSEAGRLPETPVAISYAFDQAKSFDDNKLRQQSKGRSLKSSISRNTVMSRTLEESHRIWPLSACAYPELDIEPKLPKKEELREEDEDDLDLCYDSDPTDLKYARGIKAARRKKRSSTDKFSQSVDSSPTDECDSGEDDDSIFSGLSQDVLLNLNDPNMVKAFIEETTNRRMHLIWHPSPNCQKRHKRPLKACAWIEMGCVMKRQLIYPKFSWKTVSFEGSSRKDGSSGDLRMDLNSIELLHICRVYQLNNIDRNVYPFAKKDRCFVVESFAQTAMFEARSQYERDRIVQGLKITVARLGSMIIVGDETVFDAFFTPAGCEVPGEAPLWTKKR